MEIVGRLPTIPEYFQLYINKDVDLTKHPKQCCPFHKESLPSFSYSAGKEIWRCFGACHNGGDVIALHWKNFHLKSREEAERSLKSIFGVKEEVLTFVPTETYINEDRIRVDTLLAKLSVLAKTPERWLELDYVMSMYPIEEAELAVLLNKWQSEGKEG